MTIKKNSRCCFPLENITGLVDKIWAETLDYDGHEWKVPKKTDSLAALVGQTKTTELYAITDTATRNVQLRTLLSPLLKDNDLDIRLEAMRWVIYNWGRVRGKRGSEKSWPKQFGNYETSVIESFIEIKNHDRIASWSKVLAFADSTKYAIYDARVVMSLNSILDKVGHSRKFYMPSPSSDALDDLFKILKEYVKEQNDKKRKTIKYMGYIEYMRLLHKIVEVELAPNVLEVEMRLFANSDIHAKHYKARYGL
jgi:hypothetical protein